MFRNTMKTVVLLAGFGVLFMVVGSFFGTGGLVIGLILGLVFVGGSYWFSDKLAVRAAGAKPVTEAEAPQLYAIVRDLTSRSGMPMPAIYISPAAQPNAFATGRSPKHAAVAVTQGLMQVLDEDELRGVLAHELGHVAEPRHPDHVGRRGSARWASRSSPAWRCGRRSSAAGDRDRDGNVFGALAMMILAPDRGGDAPDGALAGRASTAPTTAAPS